MTTYYKLTFGSNEMLFDQLDEAADTLGRLGALRVVQSRWDSATGILYYEDSSTTLRLDRVEIDTIYPNKEAVEAEISACHAHLRGTDLPNDE